MNDNARKEEKTQKKSKAGKCEKEQENAIL